MHKRKQSVLHHLLSFFNGYLCVCQKCVVLVKREYTNSCKGKALFWKLCYSFLLITFRHVLFGCPFLRTWCKKLQVTLFGNALIFFAAYKFEKRFSVLLYVLARSIGIFSQYKSKNWFNYLSSNCAVFCLISFYTWGAQKI